MLCHWDECLGKVWESDDSEPGELPICQSPFDPRAMGRGLSAHEILYFYPGVCNVGIFYGIRKYNTFQFQARATKA